MPQLQGAEATEVMHVGETSLIAVGSDVADAAPQTLQHRPQLQDVLSTAQAQQVQATGQQGLRVKAGQASLGRKTRWMLVKGWKMVWGGRHQVTAKWRNIGTLSALGFFLGLHPQGQQSAQAPDTGRKAEAVPRWEAGAHANSRPHSPAEGPSLIRSLATWVEAEGFALR